MMDTTGMTHVTKAELKSEFEKGNINKAWILYAAFDGEFSSGTTICTASQVDEYTTSYAECRYYIPKV